MFVVGRIIRLGFQELGIKEVFHLPLTLVLIGAVHFRVSVLVYEGKIQSR